MLIRVVYRVCINHADYEGKVRKIDQHGEQLDDCWPRFLKWEYMWSQCIYIRFLKATNSLIPLRLLGENGVKALGIMFEPKMVKLTIYFLKSTNLNIQRRARRSCSIG